MFVLCPHCQFLVAMDPASGRPPQRCPRCDALLLQAQEPAASTPVATTPPAIEVVSEATSEATTAAATDPPANVAPEPKPELEPKSRLRFKFKSKPKSGSKPEPEPGSEPAPEPAPEPKPAPEPNDEANDEAKEQDRDDQAIAMQPVADAPAPAHAGHDAAMPGAAEPDAAAAAAPATAALASATELASTGTAAAPGFVHRQRARRARSARSSRRMVAAIVALSLLLVLQLLLADRAQLARDARWRPGLTTLCNLLHCTLPPWREPAAFTLLDRDVRPRPGVPGVLRVSATFRNDARWPQPWPTLRLTLSDLDGRSVGARVFLPREYLGVAPAQATLASGQSAMLSMDVEEPGPQIVAFTFDFE